MLALGLQGSPRKKGNSDMLLAAFMGALSQRGVRTHTIDVVRSHVEPCKELTVCEKTGICPIDDEMGRDIYPLLREADIVVAASPIFFYNVSAQLKALIDRCQALWARKYMLKLNDPGHRVRRGFFLAVGATRGKQLFEGLHLTAKYFFDAIAAQYSGSLTFRGVERRGEIAQHATMRQDVERAVAELMTGLSQRRHVLFAGSAGAARTQMAAAFARLYAGERLDVACAGSEPAQGVDPVMVTAMQEKGIDMAFRKPQSLVAAMALQAPDELVTIGRSDLASLVPGSRHQDWDLPDSGGVDIIAMRAIRDMIEQRVKGYIDNLA
jgi:arsenate reductase (thioredoxin)